MPRKRHNIRECFFFLFTMTTEMLSGSSVPSYHDSTKVMNGQTQINAKLITDWLLLLFGQKYEFQRMKLKIKKKKNKHVVVT